MDNTSLIWMMGAMFGLIGLAALFLASRAHAPMTYYIGLGMFVLSVVAIFWLIGRKSEPHD